MRSILQRAAAGAAAGVVASIVMTLQMAATKKAIGEPPPKKLTRRILTLLGQRPSRPTLHAATALAHLGYGAAAGMLYATFPRNIRAGSLFGVALWAASYAGWIPKLGLMRSPSNDRPGRPTAMIAAHVTFGSALERTLRALNA